jgi:hypothetical protein
MFCRLGSSTGPSEGGSTPPHEGSNSSRSDGRGCTAPGMDNEVCRHSRQAILRRKASLRSPVLCNAFARFP